MREHLVAVCVDVSSELILKDSFTTARALALKGHIGNLVIATRCGEKMNTKRMPTKELHCRRPHVCWLHVTVCHPISLCRLSTIIVVDVERRCRRVVN